MNLIERILDKSIRLFWYYLNRPKFLMLGKKSYIKNALKIEGGKNIILGSKVFVAYKSWLAAMPLTGESDCRLEIQDGCMIGNFNHIYATKKIVIGRNVLTADKVYISDNIHGYKNISIPIMEQPIIQKKEVLIGDGSWLGENVCVIGASIGKNCVIGANSVVTKDIPDYCVAVGIPAKIIQKFNLKTEEWEKIIQ